jgi:hypothetical protein
MTATEGSRPEAKWFMPAFAGMTERAITRKALLVE